MASSRLYVTLRLCEGRVAWQVASLSVPLLSFVGEGQTSGEFFGGGEWQTFIHEVLYGELQTLMMK